jgi:hypothetical protein
MARAAHARTRAPTACANRANRANKPTACVNKANRSNHSNHANKANHADRGRQQKSFVLIMLDTLISSKTRIKLLLRFFLNAGSSAYLRGLETEFGESSNAIRQELNRFEDAGMLESEKIGNRKYFKANHRHPLFDDMQRMLRKYVGIDQIIDNVIDKMGPVLRVYVEGRLAKGLETEVIDLILIGSDINRQYLTQLINKAEPLIKKHIRYVIIGTEEERNYLKQQVVQPLLIWGKE